MKQPLVSVIIPTHNRKEMLIRLIRSVFESTYKNLEIIVIDDASTDGTFEKVQAKYKTTKHVQIFRNKINLFVSESRNVGKEHAKGKYFFYIDDDNVLDKKAIKIMVDAFEKDDMLGELGLVNYNFLNKNKILWLFTGRNMMTTKTYLPNDIAAFLKYPTWDTADVPNAFMVRAEVLRKYNISFCGFFGIMYEESDLAYRIREKGYKIQVARDAKIYHDVNEYMFHFIYDAKRVYVFARNRIIFHSVYSTPVQMIGISLFWIWGFTAFYAYQILAYNNAMHISEARKLSLIGSYLKGNIDGLLFVIRKEQLPY